jgi:hypothetical protein
METLAYANQAIITSQVIAAMRGWDDTALTDSHPGQSH